MQCKCMHTETVCVRRWCVPVITFSFQSHKAISTGWLPSPRVVDVIGGAIFFTPFTLNNAIAVTEGAISDRYPYVAQVLVRTHYSVWTFHCLSLTTALLFSGIRLVNILNVHLTKMQPGGARYLAIKTGIFKARLSYFTRERISCVYIHIFLCVCSDPCCDASHCRYIAGIRSTVHLVQCPARPNSYKHCR